MILKYSGCGVIYRKCYFIFAVILTPAGLFAMELNEFVADSISAHPSIKEQIHVFRQINRDLDIANSGWLPSVDLNASTGNYKTQSPATSQLNREYESNRIELSVTQNLFNGFDTTYQRQQNLARRNSALNEIFDSADNIALQAVQAYLNTLKQYKLAALAEKNVGYHKRILSQIRVRNTSGVGRRSELQQTEGRVARAHASLIAQQGNLQDSATKLHEVLGRYVQASKLKIPKPPALPKLSLDKLIDAALEKHPAIKVANYNVEAALADSSRAKNSHYPKLDLRLAKEKGNDIGGYSGDTDQTSLVLNLKYNFYSGGADSAGYSKKVSIVHQNQEFSTRVRRQVINTLRLAWVANESLAKQLTYLAKHSKKARQTVKSYGEEFFIGQRDLIDLLDAESESNAAESQEAVAFYDLLEAKFRILEAMGTLFPALNLDLKVAEDDIQVSKLRAQGDDSLPLNPDPDADKEINLSDHCDNTILNNTVNDYGCETKKAVKLGYKTTNSPPVAVDDRIRLEMNSVLVVRQKTLLKNDSDPDGDALRLINITQPKHGAVAFDGSKNIIYRAADGYTGKDTFTYTISDGKGEVALAKIKVTVAGRNDINLANSQFVSFKSNKSELTKGSKGKIKSIIQKVKGVKFIKLEVLAFTDSRGSEKYNLALSNRRAKALRTLLIKSGIEGKKIKAYGMGEKNPVADNSTSEGQAINRRGELRFKFK